MVEEKVSEFIRLQKNRQSVPLIRALRDEGERARRQVLENAMKQLAKGVSAEDVLERLSIQLTNKLLHSPTRTLNKAGSDNSELIDAVAQIYHLDQHDWPQFKGRLKKANRPTGHIQKFSDGLKTIKSQLSFFHLKWNAWKKTVKV